MQLMYDTFKSRTATPCRGAHQTGISKINVLRFTRTVISCHTIFHFVRLLNMSETRKHKHENMSAAINEHRRLRSRRRTDTNRCVVKTLIGYLCVYALIASDSGYSREMQLPINEIALMNNV